MRFARHWARFWEIMVNQMYPKFLPLWCLLLKLLCACLRWFRERFYYFYYFSLWIWGFFFFLLKYGIMQGHCSRNTIVGVLQERSLMLCGVLLKQALLTQGLTAATQVGVMESHWHCQLPEMRVWGEFNIYHRDFRVKVNGVSTAPRGAFHQCADVQLRWWLWGCSN